MSLSHSWLASVGTIDHGGHPNSRGGGCGSRAQCGSSCYSYPKCSHLNGCCGLDNVSSTFFRSVPALHPEACAHISFYGIRKVFVYVCE